MPTSAKHSAGYELEYAELTGTPTYVRVAQIEDLVPPEKEVDDIEVKTNDSPSKHREYEPGWIEPGEGSATLVYLKTQATTVYGLLAVKKRWRIIVRDAATTAASSKLEFEGYLKSVGLPMDSEDVIKMEVSIKASGLVDFTAGT